VLRTSLHRAGALSLHRAGELTPQGAGRCRCIVLGTDAQGAGQLSLHPARNWRRGRRWCRASCL